MVRLDGHAEKKFARGHLHGSGCVLHISFLMHRDLCWGPTRRQLVGRKPLGEHVQRSGCYSFAPNTTWWRVFPTRCSSCLYRILSSAARMVSLVDGPQSDFATPLSKSGRVQTGQTQKSNCRLVTLLDQMCELTKKAPRCCFWLRLVQSDSSNLMHGCIV